MKKIYGILLLMLFSLNSFGTHILGGEVTYRYLGNNGPADRPFRYQIRFVGYVDRVGTPGELSNWGCGNLEQFPLLSIYDAGTNERIPRIPGATQLLSATWLLPSHGEQVQGPCAINPYYGGIRPLVIPVPAACVVPGLSELNIAITDTTFEVQLPLSASGYKVKYENCCRTENTTNIFFPGGNNNPGNSWIASIPSPIFVNSSPQFIGDAVPFFCRGDTISISNNAFDPDGDRLIYSFAQPYSGSGGQVPPLFSEPEVANYQPGYSVEQPFGPGGYAFINPSTGLTKYFCNVNGNYAVAVDIQEYRTLSNGVEILLSTTRREFLVVVKDCAPNDEPDVIDETGEGSTFIRSEGDSVLINFQAADVDTTTIEASSELFDPLTNPGSLAVCPTVTGTDTIRTQFRWKINCGLTGGIVRNYSVVVKYSDKGCPPKTETVVYTIIVNPFKAPTILGKDSICSTDNISTYSVTAGTGREWKVLNGSIVGGNTGNSVNVTFPGDTARVRLIVTSGLGCKDSTTKVVRKFQLVPILASAGTGFVCQDSSISLNATGGYNQVNWTPTTFLNSPNIRQPKATIGDTTSFVVSSGGPGGCLAKDTVVVRWIPKTANAGSDSILCSGLSRIVGANQNTGYQYYSYQWLPSTGLSSDTSFSTLATLQNPGSGVQTVTFVQKATHRASSCVSTDTVRLAIKSLPPVNAGPDTAVICSGGKTVLGTVENESATYNWFPSSGLGTPTEDTTQVSLNPDSVQTQFVRYFLTKTEVLTSPQPGEPACSNTDSITLRINPLPFFELATQDSICSGFSTNIGTANQSGFSYLWSPSVGLTDTVSSQTSVQLTNSNSVPVDSTYFLLVTNNGTSCAREKSIRIRVNPLPLVKAGNDTTLCSGDSIRIGENGQGGFSYVWNPTNGLADDSVGSTLISLINPVVGGPAIFLPYILQKTNDQTKCKNTDTLVVKVKALPVVNAGPDSTTICSGAKTQIGTLESDSALYQWNPPSGLFFPTSDTTSVSLNPDSVQVQFYTYKLRKTEGIVLPGEPACSNIDSIVVRVNPLPFFDLASEDSICSGFSTSIGTANQTGFAYLWSPPQGLSDTDSSQTMVLLQNPGLNPVDSVYNLLVTNNTTSCARTKEIRVRVNPLPVVSAGIDTAFCSGDSISIGELNQAGFGYQWSPGNGLNSVSSSNPNISLINANTGGTSQSFQYKLTKVNSTTLCRNFDSLQVTVKPLPIANAASTDSLTICSKTNLQLGEAGLPSHQYSWVPDSALTASDTSNPVLNVNNPLQTVLVLPYKVLVTNTITTCKNIDSVFVKINPLPIVPLGYADTSVCSKDTILLGGAAQTGLAYTWSPRQLLSDSTLSLTGFSATNNTDAPVNYTFNLLVRNTGTTCQNAKNLVVRVNPLPDANAGADVEVCSRDSVQIGSSPVAGRKYTWSPTTGLSNPNIANPKLSLVNNGTANQVVVYSVSVSDTSLVTRCDSSDQVSITVKPLPNAVAGIADSVQICATVNLNLGIAGDPTLNYSWSPTNFLSAGNVANPVFNSSASTGSSFPLYVLTVLNPANGCQKKDSVEIQVNGLPPVNPGTADSLCSGDTLQIGPDVIQVPLNYQWSPQTGFVNTNPVNPSLTLINPGNTVLVQTYKFLVTNTVTGCRDSVNLNVRVNPLPQANAGSDRTICSGGSVELGTESQLGFGYQWSLNPGLNFNTISNPVFTNTIAQVPARDTLVVLMTNTQTQCKRSDTTIVTTNPRPLPVVFGPFSPVVCPFTPNVGYSVTNSEAGHTFVWEVSGGSQASGGNTNAITVNWNGTNAGARVFVTPTNAFGCQGTRDSIQLIINQNLKPPGPFGDSVLCSYNKTGRIYSTIPTPGSTYTWKFLGAGVDSTQSTNGQTQVDWNINDGFAYVWIQQQSSTIDPGTQTPIQCFGKSDTLRVRINPSPDSTLSIFGPQAVCGSPSGSVTEYVLPGFAGSSFQWAVSPEVPVVSGQTTDSIRFSFSTPGSYQVSVLETSDKGCVGRPRILSVQVNPIPTPGLLPLTTLNICPNDLQKGYFAAVQPGFEGSSFQWSLSGGTLTTPANEDFVGITWNVNGPYSLVLRQTSAQGCSKDTVLPLLSDPSSITLSNVSLLENDENQVGLTFAMGSPETNPSNLSIWRKVRGSSTWTEIQSGIPKTITSYIDQPGQTDATVYEYQIRSTNLCAKAIESEVHNTLLLKVEAPSTGQTARLNWNSYVGWPFGAGYSVLRKVDNEPELLTYESGIPDQANLEKIYENAPDGFRQCYRIVAFQNQGQNQAFSNTVCVTFDNPLELFNLITPNGDQKNDTWAIRNLHLYPDNELVIFDRWGKEVFKKTNYANDGLWDGGDFGDGVYFYRFTVPGRSLEYQGWLTIKRD
jgi:gliding motility-associated-like protein